MKKLSLLIALLTITGYSYAACNTNMTLTAPNNRYELLNGGGEVKDIQTGLIWQRCSLGQEWNGASCAGNAAVYNWTNALQTAKNMGSGWRIPNVKELESLVELACYSPSINETYFPNSMVDWYWSSSPVANSNYTWIVHFDLGYGGGDNKSNNHHVRLVRSSQ